MVCYGNEVIKYCMEIDECYDFECYEEIFVSSFFLKIVDVYWLSKKIVD